MTFESLAPTFRFGHGLATREPFRSSPWSAVEADARRIWEAKNPGTWEQSKAVVKYAWESGTPGSRGRGDDETHGPRGRLLQGPRSLTRREGSLSVWRRI